MQCQYLEIVKELRQNIPLKPIILEKNPPKTIGWHILFFSLQVTFQPEINQKLNTIILPHHYGNNIWRKSAATGVASPRRERKGTW